MGEIKLWKRVIWQVIEDYLKERGINRDKSEDLLFGTGEHRRHFIWMCDAAGYEPEYVRMRVRKTEGRKYTGQFAIHLGRNVMGEWGRSCDYNRSHWKNSKRRPRCSNST